MSIGQSDENVIGVSGSPSNNCGGLWALWQEDNNNDNLAISCTHNGKELYLAIHNDANIVLTPDNKDNIHFKIAIKG